MKRSNVTRKDLARAIHDTMGFSQQSSETLVKTVFNSMKKALLTGNDVKIVNFGSLTVRKKATRIGRNPRTGEAMEISKRKMVSFKASRGLRNKLNSKNNGS
jgi:integration host factor subunit alpha